MVAIADRPHHRDQVGGRHAAAGRGNLDPSTMAAAPAALEHDPTEVRVPSNAKFKGPASYFPSIRRARAEDAAALATFAEAAFRATFGADNTAEDMDLHCHRSFGAATQGAEIADPMTLTLVSEHDGALVGFAQLRWGAAPACVVAERPVEIQRLYVDGAWHGRGIAQALMTACFDAMARRASDVAWLGVWERNGRAIAFYRRTGFADVGDHVFRLGTDPQRDVVMVKAVGREPGA